MGGCLSSPDSGNRVGNYEVQRVIGKGGFGRVNAVTDREGKWFAMKAYKKHVFVEKHNVESLIIERGLLAVVKHPFLVNMHKCFQDDRYCYMVMDLCLGGDMRYLMNNSLKVLDEKGVRFYMACVLEFLDYLHTSPRILHRDLKPDNCYVKVTDLGISQKMDEGGRCFDNSGTRVYQAPELREPPSDHGVPSDLYSLAATAFEMLAGSRPFEARAASRASMSDSGKKELHKGDEEVDKRVQSIKVLSEAGRAWLLKGLRRKEADRFQTAQAMKEHEWFADFDWTGLNAKTMKPPFLPNANRANVDGSADVMAFIDKDEEVPTVSMGDDMLFKGYDYPPSSPVKSGSSLKLTIRKITGMAKLGKKSTLEPMPVDRNASAPSSLKRSIKRDVTSPVPEYARVRSNSLTDFRVDPAVVAHSPVVLVKSRSPTSEEEKSVATGSALSYTVAEEKVPG